jgi:hypothetical protein
MGGLVDQQVDRRRRVAATLGPGDEQLPDAQPRVFASSIRDHLDAVRHRQRAADLVVRMAVMPALAAGDHDRPGLDASSQPLDGLAGRGVLAQAQLRMAKQRTDHAGDQPSAEQQPEHAGEPPTQHAWPGQSRHQALEPGGGRQRGGGQQLGDQIAAVVEEAEGRQIPRGVEQGRAGDQAREREQPDLARARLPASRDHDQADPRSTEPEQDRRGVEAREGWALRRLRSQRPPDHEREQGPGREQPRERGDGEPRDLGPGELAIDDDPRHRAEQREGDQRRGAEPGARQSPEQLVVQIRIAGQRVDDHAREQPAEHQVGGLRSATTRA